MWKIFLPLFLSACLAMGSPRDCPECPEMVVIPAGSFTMGSPASEPGHNSFLTEDPERRVNIRPFAIGKFDITRGQWAAFVAATNRDTRPGCFWTGRPGTLD